MLQSRTTFQRLSIETKASEQCLDFSELLFIVISENFDKNFNMKLMKIRNNKIVFDVSSLLMQSKRDILNDHKYWFVRMSVIPEEQ